MLHSRKTTIEGIEAHYWEGGPEGETRGLPVLMVHGVGPGTSIQGNFGPVLEPLASTRRVVAMDLIGFGGSGRKPAAPYFDVELWLRQAQAMLALLPDGPVGVAGHSMGGALMLKLAARNPRITRVLTSSTVGMHYPIPPALEQFWSAGPDRVALREAMQRMVADPGAVTDAMIEDRYKLLASGDYARYFAEMFAAPRQRYLDAAVLTPQELGSIGARVTMLHGRDDQPCPPEVTTLVLARHLPQADVLLLGRCGHNLPRERTAAYIAAAAELFSS
jgi:2-hydroxymuconate-semialdehyde hydrolase